MTVNKDRHVIIRHNIPDFSPEQQVRGGYYPYYLAGIDKDGEVHYLGVDFNFYDLVDLCNKINKIIESLAEDVMI